MKRRHAGIITAAWIFAATVMGAESAKDILKSAGFSGGVVIHVGCGDAQLTVELAKGENTIVQGLDTSADHIAAARKTIAKSGLGGRVTARVFDGKTLPFIDGMVNLIVLPNAECRLPNEEIRRVLAPRGTVVDTRGGVRMTFRKPVPSDIDDWTHYHHDPSGTMVGNDRVVGPPRRIQWMGGPKWLRNHDFMSSMHAMVSANGKVFYIIDEGLRNHIFLPSTWVLVARDGFNGTILWRKPLKDWHPSNWPLKSGPGHLPRRLVAVGDTVYVTGGLIQPVAAMDALTGETIRTYADTKPTEELIVSDGVLFALVDPERKRPDYKAASTSYKEIGRASSGWAWSPEKPARCITAVETDSGEVLWRHEAKVAPLSLTATDTSVFYHNGTGMVALDRRNGKQIWASEGPGVKKVGTGSTLRVAYSDGVVVFASGTKLAAFDAKDGKQLWTGSLLHTSHHCPEDLFIIDGLIWSPNTGKAQHNGTHFKVMDLHTGEVTKDFVAKNLPGFPMHPRCYPSRATTRYIMTNGMGTEFYELGGKTVDINNIVRGSCIYGVMPCNGLLYKPPDSCACYYQSKLEHFCALAPESQGSGDRSQGSGSRLEKGSAYGSNPKSEIRNPKSTDWPMYRHDSARSGACKTALPAKLKPAWTVKLEGKLTQPVVAFGKAFVAAVEGHTLHALDTRSGKETWRFTAGGRIDSAPTLYNGTVLFGCADGWVYCLRAADGAVAWRYRVAPDARQIVSYQQLESVWPVHGCVLLQNDTIYALAGRNMFFDGGMRLVLLEPATGKMISETILDENDPATGKNLQTLISAKYMPVANRDILSSDGERVYMREQNFDMKGKRIGVAPTQPGKNSASSTKGRHLFCQTGLLDDVWFHRSYWIYGSDCGEGWGAYAGTRRNTPCGRIMAFDDSRAYAFRSNPLGNMLHPRTSYQLYAADKNPAAAPAAAPKGKRKKGEKRPARSSSGFKTHWKMESPPLFVNAMALGAENLFVAGPPDVADETKMLGFLPGAKDDLNRQLHAQDDAWRGKSGGLLLAVSAETGEKLAEYKLASYPVFDGMSVADGKLFMALKDGSVVCYGGE